jgi:Ribonuclease G/E
MADMIDRVILEVSPGQARAVAFVGDEPWEIAIERLSDEPSEGDIFRARAGAPGPDGGRFFDLGNGRVGLARRAKSDWTEGSYGLVQVLRGDAGDKGARVTDRVWLNQGGLSVSLGADGKKSDRIEISRGLPKAIRSELRDRLELTLPKSVSVRVMQASPGEIEADVRAMAKFLLNLENIGGSPRQVHQAPGEIEQLATRARSATWVAADLASNVWAGSFGVSFGKPDQSVALEIDRAISTGLDSQVYLPGGGNLWIEPTRALTAIDIDSGSREQENINEDAAREIARQIRLRRLGGIISIDFIRSNIKPALEILEEFSKVDPWAWRAPKEADAVGLVSFQRERRGQSLANLTSGTTAIALDSLRFICRCARDGATVIEAPGAVIDILLGVLHSEYLDAQQRIGGPIELVRSKKSRVVFIKDRNGKVLQQI